jgi:hypothetical protein
VSDDAIGLRAELPSLGDWKLVKVHITQLDFSLMGMICSNGTARRLANGLHALDKSTLLWYIITFASRYCLVILLIFVPS